MRKALFQGTLFCRLRRLGLGFGLGLGVPASVRLLVRPTRKPHQWLIDLREAQRAAIKGRERAWRAIAVALWLALLPLRAHAGIWNGGLCTVYQDVLDNELLEIVSLTMLVGSLILWGLDDGRHNIKTSVIRGVAVTMGVLNMPLLWAQVFNHGAACSGSM